MIPKTNKVSVIEICRAGDIWDFFKIQNDQLYTTKYVDCRPYVEVLGVPDKWQLWDFKNFIYLLTRYMLVNFTAISFNIT